MTRKYSYHYLKHPLFIIDNSLTEIVKFIDALYIIHFLLHYIFCNNKTLQCHDNLFNNLTH